MLFPLTRPEIFAILGVIVSLVRYGTYIQSILKGKTKPHVFSWFNWGLMVGIGAFAQYRLGGGPSVIVLVVVSSVCFFIALMALFRGEKNITRTDWIAFLGALMAIPVWQVTDSPFGAIAMIMLIDLLSYYPTIRKSWMDPYSEPAGSYFWAGLRYFLAMFAVPEFTVHQLVYPFFLMAGDWGFMLFLLLRRHVLRSIARIPGDDRP